MFENGISVLLRYDINREITLKKKMLKGEINSEIVAEPLALIPGSTDRFSNHHFQSSLYLPKYMV